MLDPHLAVVRGLECLDKTFKLYRLKLASGRFTHVGQIRGVEIRLSGPPVLQVTAGWEIN